MNQIFTPSAKASAVSAKGRTERQDKPSPRTHVQDVIARIRPWLDKPVSFAAATLDRVPILGAFLRLRAAWVLVIFVVGFATGMALQSYGGKSANSSERLKAMSLALSTARKNLDKLASDMSRLETQGLDAPQRRSR
jgi:hypothetical protein